MVKDTNILTLFNFWMVILAWHAEHIFLSPAVDWRNPRTTKSDRLQRRIITPFGAILYYALSQTIYTLDSLVETAIRILTATKLPGSAVSRSHDRVFGRSYVSTGDPLMDV